MIWRSLATTVAVMVCVGPVSAQEKVPLDHAAYEEWRAIDDAALLARLPEVEALLDRALALDEAWDDGALHEFKVIVAGSQPGRSGDAAVIKRHYARALELSKGASAGLFVAYAEAVSLPAQDRAEFQSMLERALAVDPDQQPPNRLATLVSQRRARWLLGRIDDLILSSEAAKTSGGVR